MKFFGGSLQLVSARPKTRRRIQRPFFLGSMLRLLGSCFARLAVYRSSTAVATRHACCVSREEEDEKFVEYASHLREESTELHSETLYSAEHESSTNSLSASPEPVHCDAMPLSIAESSRNMSSESSHSGSESAGGSPSWEPTEHSSGDSSVSSSCSENWWNHLPSISQNPPNPDTGTFTLLGATSKVQYAVGPYLGGGGCAQVFRCESKTKCQSFALKIPHCNFEDCLQEVQAMEVMKAAAGSCQYVVRLEELAMASEKQKTVGLIMELCDFDLAEFLQNYDLPVAVQMELTRQLIVGLDFLHSVGITHGDLSTYNVLVSLRNACLKISDFGESRMNYTPRMTEEATSAETWAQTTRAPFSPQLGYNDAARDDLDAAAKIVVLLWLEDTTGSIDVFDVANCVYQESLCKGWTLGDEADELCLRKLCKKLQRRGIRIPACIVLDFLMQCLRLDEGDAPVSAKRIACKMEEHVSADVRQESSSAFRTLHEKYKTRKASSGPEM